MSLLDSILRRKQEQEKPKSLLDSILERKGSSLPPEPAQVETSTAFTAPERILGALNPIANVAGMLGQTDPATFGPAMASRFLDSAAGSIYGMGEFIGLVDSGTRAEMRAEVQKKANAAAQASGNKTLVKAGDIGAMVAGPMLAGAGTGSLLMGATRGLVPAAGVAVRAGAGALEGALQGIGDRPDDAKTGALLGGAFGAGGSLIGDAVGAGFRALGAKGRAKADASDFIKDLDSRKVRPVEDISDYKPEIMTPPGYEPSAPTKLEEMIRPLDELQPLPAKVRPMPLSKTYGISPAGEVSEAGDGEGFIKILVDERGRIKRLSGESPTASQLEAMKASNIDLLIKDIKSSRKTKIVEVDADSAKDMASFVTAKDNDPLGEIDVTFKIRPDSPKADRAAASAIPGSDAWEKEVFEAKRQGFDLADAQLREKLTRKNPKGWRAAAKADSDSMVYKLKEIANGPLSFVTKFGRYGGIPLPKRMRSVDPRANPINVRNLRMSYAQDAVRKFVGNEIPAERLSALHQIKRAEFEAQNLWDQAADGLIKYSKSSGSNYEDLKRLIGRARKTRDWSAVPEEARAIVKPSFDFLDKDLSQALISDGVEPSKAHAIAYRIGEYFHEDYMAFKDPKYWDAVKDTPLADAAIQRKMMELIERGVDPEEDLLEAAKGELGAMIKRGAGLEGPARAGTPLFKRVNRDSLMTTMKQKEISYQGLREEMGREISAELKEKFGKEVLSSNEIDDAIDHDALVNKFLSELPNQNAAKRIDRSYQLGLDKHPELRADSKLLSPLLKDKKERLFRDAIREEDFPDVYKKLFGEVDDAESLFLNTVAETAQLKYQSKLFNKIKNRGLELGLVSLEPRPGADAPLAAPGFTGMVEASKGQGVVYVEDGLHQFITAIADRLPDAGRLMAAVNTVKLGKVASPWGLLRNLYSATTVNTIANGDVLAYKHLLKGLRAAAGDINAQLGSAPRRAMKSAGRSINKTAFAKSLVADLSPDGTPNGFLKEIYRKTELGIMEGGAGREVANVADFLEKSGIAAGGIDKAEKGALKAAYRVAGEFLQSPEKALKFAAHEARKTELSWAYGRPVDEAIEKEAANLVNDTYQTYEQSWELGRALSRSPITANFASFAIEMARNQGNIIKEGVSYVQRASAALTSGDAAQAGRWASLAVKKATGLVTATAGLAYAGKAFSDATTGWTKDTYDAFKDVVMFKGTQSQEPFIYDYDKKNHKVKYLDMKSIDPYWIEDVVSAAALHPGSVLDKTKFLLDEMSMQVFQPGIMYKAAVEAATGRNVRGWVQTGGEFKYDDPVNDYPELLMEGKAGRRAYRTMRNLAPSFVTKGEDLARSNETFGLRKQVGSKEYDPAQEAFYMATGIKGQVSDINAAFRYHIADEYRGVDVLRRSLRKDLEKARLNPSTRRQAYDSRREEYEKLYGRLTWRVKEMRDLDYSDREIYEMLKNTKANKTIGISAALARNIVYSPEYPLPLERAFTFDFDK